MVSQQHHICKSQQGTWPILILHHDGDFTIHEGDRLHFVTHASHDSEPGQTPASIQLAYILHRIGPGHAVDERHLKGRLRPMKGMASESGDEPVESHLVHVREKALKSTNGLDKMKF